MPWQGRHPSVLTQDGPPARRIGRPAGFQERDQLRGILQQDTTPRGFGHHPTQIGQKGGRLKQLAHIRPALVDELPRHLQGRTKLQRPAGRDMMAHARRRRTERPPVGIPIGLDQEQRRVAALLDHETTESLDLLLGQGILRMGIRAYRPINIIPQIMGTRPGDPLM